MPGLPVRIGDLSVTYAPRSGSAELKAVDSATFSVTAGQIVAIVGPSGCGKTTVLNVLAGFLPFTGTVLLGDREPGRRRDLGYMFQKDALLPWRSLLSNVEFPLEIRGVGPAQRRSAAMDLLDRLKLGGFASSFPHEVSGGMAKRVALAQNLIHAPAILLLDEPFGALDAFTRAEVEQDLLRLLEQTATTAVFVTHNLQEAIALSDRVLVMSARPGRILADHRIDLPRPRSILDVQYSPRFAELEAAIWTSLRGEIVGAGGRDA